MLARYMNVVSSSVKSTLLTIPFLFISRCSQLQYICIPFVSISFLPLPTVPVGVPSCNISSFLSSQFLFSHFSLYHLVFPVAIYLLSVRLNFFSPTSHCTIRCSQLQYIFFPLVSISFPPLLTVPFGVPSCNISYFRSSQFLFSHFSRYHYVFCYNFVVFWTGVSQVL